MPGPSIISPQNVLDVVSGAVKGNTADLLGAPNDILVLIGNATSKTLAADGGIEAKYGSKYFRKIFFGAGSEENRSIAETAGTFISPGGAATVGKAMIVGALPKLEIIGTSAVRAAKILTDVESLNTAEKNVAFFQQTGVFKGGEGAAKAVLSDSAAGINRQMLSKTVSANGEIVTHLNTELGTTLGEVLDHPELYKMYPQLKDYKVLSDASMPLGDAAFLANSKTLILGPQASGDKLMSRVLHETQHAVQSIEDFARGTNPVAQAASPRYFDESGFIKKLQDRRASGDKSAEGMLKVINEKRAEAFKAYEKAPGEAEARFTESTMKMTEGELNKRVSDVLANPTPTSFWDR